MPTIRGVLTLLAVAVVAACGDDDNLPDPTEENVVDTITVGSLTDTPITTASGFAVISALPVRTDQEGGAGFDVAYDILGSPDTGQSVLLPRAALGIVSGSTAEPGLMRRDEAFDAITVAPSNGYVTEEAVPIAVGDRYIVRSRVTCALAVPFYAKIEVLSFEDNSVTLKVLANVNCGYRGLEPGLPDR
jgi:hypothetical protein